MNQSIETTVRHDTKEKILDVAERLFAEQGFLGTSLRHITAEAGVNLAAVNYHFRTKEALLTAVMERRVVPVNKRRLEMLEELERKAGDGPVDAGDVMRAFLQPIFEARAAGVKTTHFALLMARILSEHDGQGVAVMLPTFEATIKRFLPLLQRALGQGGPKSAYAGFQFGTGAFLMTQIGKTFAEHFAEGKLALPESEELLDQLVTFIAGGMRALAEKESRL